MIPEIGHFALALALALSLAQAAVGLIGAQRADARLMGAAAPLAAGVLVAVAAAFACLVWAYVANDTTVLNVVQNSHSAKPMLYKVSGAWGNHEGSMLLWVLILALCGGAVAAFGTNLPSALQARVLGVLALVALGFLGFILGTSNPFERIWPPPMDGQGLNPILQDPGLAFHPPLLYLGYVGFAVTYAFAVAALIEGRVDAAWGRWVRPWALAAWSFLTLGIALGSWWAYYELGWGGYWFWDPVENASLMPWLAGCALLHSAIVVEKREALKTWTVFLALLAFGMSLLGTFLVRSGVLNSVHAFANDPERGTVILILLALYIGGGFLLFAWRAQAMLPTGVFTPVSREGSLVLNNLLLCSIAAVVLVGTLYPMFADLVLKEKFSVGPPFFNTAILPLAVPLIGAMALGPVLPWKRARLFPALQRLWWAALAGLAALALCLMIEGQRVGPALGFGAAAWVILAAVADIADRIALFSRPRAAWARAKGLPRAAWGGATAHAGMGVMILGLAGMGLATDTLRLVKPGETVALAGLDYRLVSVVDAPGPNFSARRATVEVRDGGTLVTVLQPERRSFPQGRMTTTEAAIHTTWLSDLYVVLGEERDGGAVLRIHNNPLAPWIWLGGAIMALGGGLSLSDRRMRVSAPAAKPVKAGARA
ncbi:heme lyase CcmF/NrfE family subunit [Belnapia rosea]|uniref:Cytochrome c-type biogenesis protein CcmF n=1 Tax=Belnapia rosea TaxID=938405 RepID=A0A1G7AEB6_9PROT|nr:heme lyase CcmF/NrfE family subunit [Belnapia rosea]SDB69806.1 cytochrome c-type biogenesis protein CcmF [Belnapia rosea]SDE13288.1 cytochrome c-type biogenesis protein CcmF [Belnapia rosea]